MKKVDLHIHSCYSDGTYTVDEILAHALQKKVEYLSITDHNEIRAYDDMRNEIKEVNLISGVEIDSVEYGIDFHILGYGFNVDDEGFRSFLDENKQRLEMVNVRLLEKVIKDHPELSIQEYDAFSYDRRLGGWELLHYFVDKGLCESIRGGFEIYAQYQHSYACVDFPSINEVCAQIHRSKGKAVLAHPGKVIPYTSYEEFESFLMKVLEHDFDGVECFYPSHDEVITNICLKACRQKGLMITCGSDCHGRFEKTEIGELNISKELLELKDLFYAE